MMIKLNVILSVRFKQFQLIFLNLEYKLYFVPTIALCN